jgi:hypothetical protein
MNILDIDVDVFIEPRPDFGIGKGRLDGTTFKPWSPTKLERFLVEQCGLCQDNPVPGRIVTYHHELFDLWDELIADARLDSPFSLTHVDSHADMGLGDASCGYIMCDLIHGSFADRKKFRRSGSDGLLEGNYLSFALACRWIKHIKYVQHPETRNHNDGGLPDIADAMFKNSDPNCGIIQLRAFPRGSDNGIDRYWEIHDPISFEPEVPIEFHDRDTFQNEDSFSFLFAAQSPNYTPKSADMLLSVIEKFMEPI